MSELFAQPYNIDATGFYFDSVESYQRQAGALRDRFNQPVEEFEIQFIDGEEIDAALFDALSVTQANLERYFEAVDTWEDYEKLRVVIAVGECCCDFGPDSKPDDFDVDIYEMDSLEELARHYVEEGLFGDIPENIRNYLDMEAIAYDLSMDHGETDIAGRHYIYRCG